MTFIRAFYTHGHLNANVDPLELEKVYGDDLTSAFNTQKVTAHDLLDISHYGFTEADLDRTFNIDYIHFDGLIK